MFWFLSDIYVCLGFPGGSSGKDSICNAGDLGSVPGFGRSPREWNSYPFQYTGLENSMECIVHGVAKSWKWWLNDFHFHFMSVCAYVLSCFSRVWLCDTMDYTLHGILQAKILEWVAFPFSRGSSQPRDQTQVFHIAGGFFTNWTTGKPKKLEWVAYPFSSRSSQPRNQTGGLLHCRWILYNWANREAPKITGKHKY